MIIHPHGPQGLLARERELARISDLLTAAGAGRGGTLVVAGEPGIGKTALLRQSTEDAGDVRVLRTTGLELEAAFGYAALHTLCASLLSGLEHLPVPQRDALRVVFGLAQGEAPNRFLVGLAVLGLLSEAAQERPLLCVVDDAQWLDRASAQALAFVAHRVDRERIALVLAVREPDSVPELADLPRLPLTGLPHEAARTLLVSEFRAPLDDQVRERILAEAQGNPLALLELPRTVGPSRAAGGFGLPQAVPLSRRIEESFRHTGALGSLAVGLAMLAAAAAQAGDFARATALITEEEALAAVTGALALPYPRLHLESVRGRAAAEPFLSRTLREAVERDDGQATAAAHWALAVLHNGLADYPAALEHARAAARRAEPAITGLALIELVEAAVRCGEPAEAAEALAALTRRTGPAVTDWARGVEAYCQALTAGDDARAEHRFLEAVQRLRGCRVVLHPARAHLVFGQWLRRAGRRREAREQLRAALEMFSSTGAEAFAALAVQELRATGEHTRRPTRDSAQQLTGRELDIARLVATGATSKEIGVRLFLSPRTVDAHLRSIFRKLGITSRRQLRNWKGIA